MDLNLDNGLKLGVLRDGNPVAGLQIFEYWIKRRENM